MATFSINAQLLRWALRNRLPQRCDGNGELLLSLGRCAWFNPNGIAKVAAMAERTTP